MIRHVLIAEDSNSLRELLAGVCSSLPDVVVHEASDGRWALQQAQKLEQLHLVVTDINMPGMDGIELIRQLSTLPHRPALLLLSGFVPELLESCMRAAEEMGFPAIDYQAKPVTPEKLLLTVRKLLHAGSLATSGKEVTLPLPEIIAGLAHNQFCAFFQPIFSQTTQQAVQIEALARWQHPDYGILGPDSFIKSLESAGFIILLTRRIVQTSLDLLARNVFAQHLRLSLNLSHSLLDDNEFFDWLVQELEQRGIEPSRIVLEVTETMAFSDFGQSLAILLRLRMRGFELSLDDFGTGHANLDQLKDLPLTELKFDRSLIKGIYRSAKAQSILAGIVSIGRDLGLRMVAEGIDNPLDLQYLQQTFPDLELQGFLLSLPVLSADLPLNIQFTDDTGHHIASA